STFPDRSRAAYAGYLGGMNAVGCVLGALLTGFVLIPTLGSELTLKALGLSLVLCCAVLALRLGARIQRIVATGVVAAVAIPVTLSPPWDRLALTSGEHVYFERNQVWPESRIEFFHEDTAGGITTVVRNPPGVRGQRREWMTLLTNGK